MHAMLKQRAAQVCSQHVQHSAFVMGCPLNCTSQLLTKRFLVALMLHE